ncbi:MAG: hypothetical protein ABI132_10675 [Rhodanobacteraceae bacterium]
MSDRAENYSSGTAAGDASAHAAAMPQADPRIALFYADDALLAHVESALTEAGVPVACKIRVDQVDCAALAAATIALINLDDLCDDKLDALTATLDAAGIPVVFNDAIISRGLDGWARARWTRHLVAKLRGSVDVDPPRPAANGSQAFPPSGFRPACPANGGREYPSHVADGVSAARPLTQNEIESLLADFPSDSCDAGRDANALSEHVDALLANAADGASNEPPPWEAALAPESPVSTHQQIQSPFAAATSAADAWQLVDEPTVFSAPRESAPVPVTAVAQTGTVDFELEPIEHVMPALVREREFEEMRVDDVKSARRAEKNVKSVKRAGKVK